MGRIRRHMPCTTPAACAVALMVGGAMFAGAWAAGDCRDPGACGASVPGGSLAALAPDGSMVSDLVGAAVIDRRGERLGTVSDAVLDRDMRVVALAVKVGWLFGVPTRTVAVPIGALHRPADAVPDPAGTHGEGGGGAGAEGGLGATLDALMAGGSPGRGHARGGRLVSDLTRAELLAAPTFRGR